MLFGACGYDLLILYYESLKSVLSSPIPVLSFRFYAGGSERSGQQILGPPKKKSSHEVVEDLFKGAKEHGAVPVDRAGKSPGESSKARVCH